MIILTKTIKLTKVIILIKRSMIFDHTIVVDHRHWSVVKVEKITYNQNVQNDHTDQRSY